MADNRGQMRLKWAKLIIGFVLMMVMLVMMGVYGVQLNPFILAIPGILMGVDEEKLLRWFKK